ncbi:Long-chain fatty acid transport protein [Moritella sp. JT01]|uniref:outer membrane protein transport protein n=1 Tax=Moritella sp. JT01 TaxID=756698 RepID=UPI00079A50E0|nr:outer membrane protein transport protein [Moritella sp. JT01]KXO13626.1 Long-chain fatty acid transport protein [Moritella sp. JT01]
MRINKVALAVTALLAASQVNAAGFQVSEHSASGLGRAFAGEAAIGDNAASLARNPALMATFDKAQLSVVASYVSPDVDAESSTFGKADDIAPAQVVPAMYYIQPINDKVAVGLAIYSNYGTGTEYPNNYAAGAVAGTTSIATVNFNPNVSYRINEQFSVGAGVSFVYASAELKRNAGALAPALSAGKINDPTMNVATMEGDGYGFGWNVGALYEINKNNRLGISYKSKVKTELKGDYTGIASSTLLSGSPLLDQKTVDGTLDIDLPSILEVSGYHKLTDKFAVSYSWMYTTWSDFGDIVAEGSECGKIPLPGSTPGVCLEKKEDYSNSSRYSVGGEYYLSEVVTLRAGYAFDEQGGEATLSIPDTDRQWYTAGMTYKATPALSFDFAAALVAGKEIEFKEELTTGVSGTFKSSGDAYIYSAQMNYSF